MLSVSSGKGIRIFFFFFQLQQCKMMGDLKSSSLDAAAGSPAGMSAACGEGKPAPYKLCLTCNGRGVPLVSKQSKEFVPSLITFAPEPVHG